MSTAVAIVGEWRILDLRSSRPVGGKGGAGVDAEETVDVAEVLFDSLDRALGRAASSGVTSVLSVK
jgi:hypothetical protein